ncbi:peroxiredoxin family protein [Thiohalorhabdus sp. Cl-TMA]|uniref:Peroxiredoxin family protein n=1 Tax=Thiohalorhabdus methylotrophus TaxID=3242694 RepID=A0ABV4TWA9_9GAMM
MAVARPGEVVANFRLTDRQGRPVSLWDYKHRRPVVLVLPERDASGLLSGFAEHYPDYRRSGGEVLALVPGTAPAAELPFPVLRDPRGATGDRMTRNRPSVLVLDSYGELFARWEGAEAAAPDHGEIADWLFFTQVQCEECGIMAPHWRRTEA